MAEAAIEQYAEELGVQHKLTEEGEIAVKAVQKAPPRPVHVLRQIARMQCLETVKGTRQDAQGIGLAAVCANEHSEWREWKKHLPGEEKMALRVFRGGAVWTPTRQSRGREEHTVSHVCPLCAAEYASASHYFSECPAMDGARAEMSHKYGIDEGVVAQHGGMHKKDGVGNYHRIRRSEACGSTADCSLHYRY